LVEQRLANYNEISPKLLFMPPRLVGVVQHLHFPVFMCVLHLFLSEANFHFRGLRLF